MYSSSLQYIPLGNACQCNIQTGESRVNTISSSTEGLPSLPFMYHHCPHFIRRFGKIMEDVYTTEGKITTTTKFHTTETTSSKLSNLSIAGMNYQNGQYLYILQTSHTHSDPITEERTFLNGMSPLSKHVKNSLLLFLGDALSWLTRTPITRDVRDIKKRFNQLIETQTQQHEIIVMSSQY